MTPVRMFIIILLSIVFLVFGALMLITAYYQNDPERDQRLVADCEGGRRSNVHGA